MDRNTLLNRVGSALADGLQLLSLDRNTHEAIAAQLPHQMRSDAAAAFQAYEELPHPSEKDEDWRYVDVPPDITGASLAEGPGADPTLSAIETVLGDVAGRADIVDGHVISVAGTNVSNLADADLTGWESAPVMDRFAAAAGAFASSAVVIRTGRGETVDRPVYVSMEAATDGAVSIPRLIVIGGEASSVSVVVEQRSPDGLGAVALPDVEVLGGPASRVSLTVIQNWGNATTAISRHRLRSDRDGFVELAEAGFGGLFSRLHLTVDLFGQGADARIIGVSFGERDQTLDYRYFMRHSGPKTTSDMFLKGAVAGSSRSVFTGLIRIEPEGQGSNAHQTNRNLVLSDDAQADSVPNLEILANDVRCGHGSAVGPLDDEQRYYLMSRGLRRPRADRLQVLGFFEEALQRFPQQQIEPTLRAGAMSKYDRIGR